MSDAETRAAKRQKVLKTGKVVFNNSLSVLTCTVRDLSDTGAKLVFGDANFDMPDDIRLIFPQENTLRDAKVMWRKGPTAGIQFTSEARRAPARKL